MASDNRYQQQSELVTRIARVALKIIPDRFAFINLRFINANIQQSTVDAATISSAVDSVRPNGGTQIGTNLRQKILNPLVYDKLSRPNGHLDRPLLICTITDGCPSSESADAFKQEIVKCRKFLVERGYNPTAVTFCISQIGSDNSALQFLDGLRQDPEIQDVLYCTTDRLDDQLKDLKQNEKRLEVWLLHLLTKPIMERYG